MLTSEIPQPVLPGVQLLHALDVRLQDGDVPPNAPHGMLHDDDGVVLAVRVAEPRVVAVGQARHGPVDQLRGLGVHVNAVEVRRSFGGKIQIRELKLPVKLAEGGV